MFDRDKLTRRDLLKLSAAGILASSASGWFEHFARAAAPHPGRTKSCILLWMNGGPCQFHTFDVKPGGDFKAIDTSVPGIQISEHLPKLAQQMKHMALIRSMSTGEAVHDRARTLMHTGYKQLASAAYPSMGCLVSHELGQPDSELPNFVCIDGGVEGNNAAGLYRPIPAYLGPKHAPLMVSDPAKGVENVKPHYGLTELDGKADLLDRADARLLEQYGAPAIAAHRTAYKRAMQLLHSPRGKALDIDREPAKSREAYGSSQFGKACLLARRLVETGVPFVEVLLGGWDDHGGAANPVRSRSRYMDPAMATLIGDLKDRGLLDSTLIIWMGEFGRFPMTGRNRHHPRAWTTMLAGAGLKTGQVVGKTTDRGDAVKDRPVSAPDFMATMCKALGMDHAKTFRTKDARPVRMVDRAGKPVEELF
jgi:uncharacterized protein (DUF1501 family)